MDSWTTVGTRDQVEPGQPLGASVGDTKIGVYEIDGKLHAVEDRCPHAEALLSQGFVEGCEVECSLHGAAFDVTSGKFLRGEPCRDLRTYPVRLAGQEIEVQVAA